MKIIKYKFIYFNYPFKPLTLPSPHPIYTKKMTQVKGAKIAGYTTAPPVIGWGEGEGEGGYKLWYSCGALRPYVHPYVLPYVLPHPNLALSP